MVMRVDCWLSSGLKKSGALWNLMNASRLPNESLLTPSCFCLWDPWQVAPHPFQCDPVNLAPHMLCAAMNTHQSLQWDRLAWDKVRSSIHGSENGSEVRGQYYSACEMCMILSQSALPNPK